MATTHTKRRKPLNRREAAALARKYIGPRGGAIIRRRHFGFGSLQTSSTTKQVVEVRAVADVVVHGQHPHSWRKAFEDAGIYETEGV